MAAVVARTCPGAVGTRPGAAAGDRDHGGVATTGGEPRPC